jgi:hypothetical protein
MFQRREVTINSSGGYMTAPFWKGRRIQKAISRGKSVKILRAAVADLKPRHTPLQIEDAKSA